MIARGAVLSDVPKKSTSLRFTDETLQIIGALAQDMGGASMTDVLTQAVRDLAKARGILKPVEFEPKAEPSLRKGKKT